MELSENMRAKGRKVECTYQVWDPLGEVLGVSRIPDKPPNVVLKIANPRNHQGADTDASTRGFISKLELWSKYTHHSGAGTWTLRWVTAGFLGAGLVRVGEFLKLLVPHSDMGHALQFFLELTWATGCRVCLSRGQGWRTFSEFLGSHRGQQDKHFKTHFGILFSSKVTEDYWKAK